MKAALLFVLAACAARGDTLGAMKSRLVLGLPVDKGMQEAYRGEVAINGVPARLFIYRWDGGFGRLSADAAGMGWKRKADLGTAFAGPEGEIRASLWGRNGKVLLLALPRGKTGWVAMALFRDMPRFGERGADAPGRDPAGFPRTGAALRILHVAGPGYEAACYRSPAPPSAVLADARRLLSALGWKADILAGSAVTASARGRPVLTVHARPDGRGSNYLVLATEEPER
jgi:hypothetical protein